MCFFGLAQVFVTYQEINTTEVTFSANKMLPENLLFQDSETEQGGIAKKHIVYFCLYNFQSCINNVFL